MQPTDVEIPPVTKTIVYAGSPEHAFDRFTEGFTTWWPLPTHSVGGPDNAQSAGFERLEVGGQLVERCRSGDLHVWGSIVAARTASASPGTSAATRTPRN